MFGSATNKEVTLLVTMSSCDSFVIIGHVELNKLCLVNELARFANDG